MESGGSGQRMGTEDDYCQSADGWTGWGGQQEELQVEGRRLEAGSHGLRLWRGGGHEDMVHRDDGDLNGSVLKMVGRSE